MLQVILGVIRCISDFKQPCVSKTAGLRAKHTPNSLCYPVLCGHCLSSCQAERQAPGLLVSVTDGATENIHLFNLKESAYSVVLTAYPRPHENAIVLALEKTNIL